jgi:hypothetical protein
MRYDLVSVDPGRDHIALACWVDRELARCTLLAVDGRQEIGAVATDLAALLESQDRADVVVVEYMCHRAGEAKSQARDLIDVTISGTAVAARLGDELIYVSATSWKGQAPKAVIQRRVVERLSGIEMTALAATLCVVPRGRHHDLYDAVGIGLYHLGRMG